MSKLMSPEVVFGATNSIHRFVEDHENKPFSNDLGDFLVYTAELATSRIIGEREANFMRLFKRAKWYCNSWRFIYRKRARATSQHWNNARDANWPISFHLEGSPTYCFNGDTLDARLYFDRRNA